MPPALLQSALKAFPDSDFVQVYGLYRGYCGAVTVLSPEAHRDDANPGRLVRAGQACGEVEVRVVGPGQA